MTRRALLLACAALWACTTQRSVGSTCDDGRCEALQGGSGAACVVTTVSPAFGASEVDSVSMCVYDTVPVGSDAMTPCRVYLLTASEASCADMDLLDVTDRVPPMGGPICELMQLTVPLRGLDSRDGIATAWYVDDDLAPTEPCSERTAQRVVINGVVPTGAFMWLSCAIAIALPSEVGQSGQEPITVDPELCAGLGPLPQRTPEDMGAYCEPHLMPNEGFQVDRDYVDVRTEQCSSGVCVANTYNAPVQSPCLFPEECKPVLDDRAYCSCRCDPKGDTSRAGCACPDNYECRDILSAAAPESIAGGYCVRTDVM